MIILRVEKETSCVIFDEPLKVDRYPGKYPSQQARVDYKWLRTVPHENLEGRFMSRSGRPETMNRSVSTLPLRQDPQSSGSRPFAFRSISCLHSVQKHRRIKETINVTSPQELSTVQVSFQTKHIINITLLLQPRNLPEPSRKRVFSVTAPARTKVPARAERARAHSAPRRRTADSPLSLLGNTINSDLYLQQLMILKQEVEKKGPEFNNRKDVVFHHDNVKPHTSLDTQQILREFGSEVQVTSDRFGRPPADLILPVRRAPMYANTGRDPLSWTLRRRPEESTDRHVNAGLYIGLRSSTVGWQSASMQHLTKLPKYKYGNYFDIMLLERQDSLTEMKMKPKELKKERRRARRSSGQKQLLRAK
ncbi:hypothetical protein EVAR_103217_1 [Eumeta japonica]|uniref:Mariner Mos1 transposase n=1 Tax=Eumeta variegata TaxID=151549 RepID=A0A4C1X8N9_EUMVA|nr:hypothetical protein EVAR_103217_1 [Eumeta japonica]